MRENIVNFFTQIREKLSNPSSISYINAFFNKKGIASLLVFGITVLSIPIGVELVQKQQILHSRANSSPEVGVYRVKEDNDRYTSYKTLAEMRKELAAAGWPNQDTQRPPKEVFYLYTRNGPEGRNMKCVVNKGDLSNMLPQVQVINPGDRVNITVVQKWEDEPSHIVHTAAPGSADDHPYVEHNNWSCNEWWPNVKFTNKTTGHVFDGICSVPNTGGNSGFQNISWEGNFEQRRPNEANPGLYDTFYPLGQVQSCTAVVPEAGEYSVEVFYTDRNDPNPTGCHSNGAVRTTCGFATGASGATGYSGGSTTSGGQTGTGSTLPGGTLSGGGSTPLTSLPQSSQPTTLPAPSNIQINCTNNTTAHITWSGGVDGIKGFRIRLDKNPGSSPFSTSDGDVINDQYFGSGGDFSVASNTQYKFWVNSFNDNVSNSPTSENVVFTCPGGIVPMSATPTQTVTTPTPATLTAPTDLRGFCVNNTTARVRWSRVAGATGYEITIIDHQSDGRNVIRTKETTDPSDPLVRPYVDFGTQPGMTHDWSVKATNGSTASPIASGITFSCN